MSHPRNLLLIVPVLLSLVATQSPADNQAKSDKDTNVIKIGVALLRNTSTRSVPLNFERDRLVSDINHIKRPKHAKDNTRIEAIALDSSSMDAANSQARALGCAYVVFTDLTELRESGDAAPMPRAGEIRLGHDPLANDPNAAERQEVERYAVLDFELFAAGDPSPQVDASVSDHRPTTGDGIVSGLLDRVATRVVSEIRSANSPPPMK